MLASCQLAPRAQLVLLSRIAGVYSSYSLHELTKRHPRRKRMHLAYLLLFEPDIHAAPVTNVWIVCLYRGRVDVELIRVFPRLTRLPVEYPSYVIVLYL